MRVFENYMGPQAYLVLFAWVFAEQVGFPIPAVPVLLAAGALAAADKLNLAALVTVGVAAAVLADYLWYRAGSFRSEMVGQFLRRHPDSRILRTAEGLVRRYGARSLVFAKFVPGLSLAAPPLTGISGLGEAEFLLFDAVGALIWTAGFIGIGYLCNSGVLLTSVPSWLARTFT
jgi:membrane protein DedA with SNARE-associated domain